MTDKIVMNNNPAIEKLCGDRIQIWRKTVENLDKIKSDATLAKVIRHVFHWFLTGTKEDDPDEFAMYLANDLISDQERAVAHANEIKLRRKSAADKRWACQKSEQPAAVTETSPAHANACGNVQKHAIASRCMQVKVEAGAEAKSESGVTTETKVKSESSSHQKQSGKLAARPTLEEVRRWSEDANVSEKFTENLFRRCEMVGWTAKGEPIASWRSYFLACWKEFKGKKIAEAYERLHDDGPDCGDSGNEAFTYDKKRMELYNARHSEAPIGLTTDRFNYYTVAWPHDGVALKEATEMMDRAVERGKFDWTYHSEARKTRYD